MKSLGWMSVALVLVALSEQEMWNSSRIFQIILCLVGWGVCESTENNPTTNKLAESGRV